MPLKKFLVFTITLLLSYALKAVDIDVAKYGAVADGKTINTAAIQKAIDECSKKGGGKVMFAAGTWVSGTILLKDGVQLFIDRGATLLGSTNINDYQLVEGFKDGKGYDMGYSFIGAKDAKNVGITGKGKINGNGKLLLEKNGNSKRPFLVRFVRCTNVNVADVSMEGPAAWTMHFFECKKIRAERVIIKSKGLSNNDGIDIDCSEDVVVRNCDIDSGDDAICLKATGPLPCRNIEVYNCKINTNQGAFKLGTESVGNFENINMHDCVVENTKGIKIFSVDGARLKNLSISNVTIAKTTLPILIRLGARLKTFREGDLKKSVGIIDGIRIKNVTVKSATQIAILISGIPNYPVKNVSISGLNVKLPGGGTEQQAKVNLREVEADYPEVTMFGKDMPAYGIYVRHANNVSIQNVNILLESADARPAIVGIDVRTVNFDNCKMPSTASSQPFIALNGANNVTIKNTDPSIKPATFLKIDGNSSEIVLQANEPKIVLSEGVKADAVKLKTKATLKK